jgi:hypothetical protein
MSYLMNRHSQNQQIQLETRSSTREKENEDVNEEAPAKEDNDTKKFQEIEAIPQQSLRRSTRVKKIPKRYDDYAIYVSLISNDGEPSCYQEAIEVSESAKWKVAMK